MNIRALIVDDDEQISSLLRTYMSEHNVQADVAGDGDSMRNAMLCANYDVVILDINLPGEDGLSLCLELRRKHDLPVIMVTARGEPTDRILGLELGADDYLVKPFEPRELIARIHSVLRRSRSSLAPPLVGERFGEEVFFDGWKLDRIRRQLMTPQNMVVPLSNAEFRLLWVFIESPRRVMTRDQLMDASRGRSTDAFDRSIDLLISRLRQKLEDDPRDPKLIKTIRGEGYIFDPLVMR